MPDYDTQRLVGRLEGEVAGLKQQADRMESKLDEITQTLAQAKGGMRVMLGAASVAGAAASGAVSVLWKKFGG